MRCDICILIKDNTEDVIQTLDYYVTFRDRVNRNIRIQSFLKTAIERIYVNATNFDLHAEFKHWMDLGILVPILANRIL